MANDSETMADLKSALNWYDKPVENFDKLLDEIKAGDREKIANAVRTIDLRAKHRMGLPNPYSALVNDLRRLIAAIDRH